VDYLVATLLETGELELIAEVPAQPPRPAAAPERVPSTARSTSLGAFVQEIRDEALAQLAPDEQGNVFYEFMDAGAPPAEPRSMEMIPELVAAYKKLGIETFFSH
jgi:hypothetical protein